MTGRKDDRVYLYYVDVDPGAPSLANFCSTT